MADTFHPKHGGGIQVEFSASNVAASSSNVAAITASSGSYVTAIHNGWVVGLSAGANAAFTSGSAGFTVANNGTAYSDSGSISLSLGPVSVSGQLIKTYQEVRPLLMPFSAGDSLAVLVNSSSTLLPNGSVDIQFVLYAIYKDE